MQGLINFAIISQLQFILIQNGIEFNDAKYITNTTDIFLSYFTNIIFSIIILFDLLKHKIKGIPIIIISLLSYFAGVLFFLFILNSKINGNDK